MSNTIVCNNCNINKEIKSFIGKSNECYHCVYVKKLALKRLYNYRSKCKVCEEQVPVDRKKYCSDDCMKVAKNKRRHWTQKALTDTKGWKRRFNMNINPMRSKF